MGYKRGSEQVATSCKRRKCITTRVQNGEKYRVNISKKTGDELEHISSESSTDFCDYGRFIPPASPGEKEILKDCTLRPSTTRCLAVDCEMVGVGENRSSALGRCSVVNYNGDVLFDAFVRPDEPVTDYRTRWSGIRESDLKEALSFKKARKEVKQIIKNCVLIGHSVQCDLHALNLFHPRHLLRDTSQYHPIRSLAGLPVNVTPSLKELSSILLSQNIQESEHCSVEDARAAMSLYKLCEDQWEKGLQGELNTQSYLSDLYWPSWTSGDSI